MTELEIAAKAWWETKRPNLWTEKDHLENPTVNCVFAAEDDLAKAYVRSLGAPPTVVDRLVPDPGSYEGLATGNVVKFQVGQELFQFHTHDYVKGFDIPVRVTVEEGMFKETRQYSVSYLPKTFKKDAPPASDGRCIALSGLVFYEDPPEAE